MPSVPRLRSVLAAYEDYWRMVRLGNAARRGQQKEGWFQDAGLSSRAPTAARYARRSVRSFGRRAPFQCAAGDSPAIR